MGFYEFPEYPTNINISQTVDTCSAFVDLSPFLSIQVKITFRFLYPQFVFLYFCPSSQIHMLSM